MKQFNRNNMSSCKKIKPFIAIVMFILIQTPLSKAQMSAKYLPEKPGKWMYSSNIKLPGAEVVAFNKNLAVLAEWFHQNVPMLSNPKGFDLDAWVYPIYDETYKLNKCSYAMRAEVNFNFQLFLSSGGKRTIEPPHFEFYVNNTEEGHGSNNNYKYFSQQEYDPAKVKNFSTAQKKAINDAVVKMNRVFAVYPFLKALAPGVNYYDSEVGGYGAVVVFNPERPDFWTPVTLRELGDMYLEYYTSQKDEFILPYLKKELAEFSEEELNAPAFYGHDEHFVLKANGNNEGLQLMRFNPEYWDKSLPLSAIQFMTFIYKQSPADELEEYFSKNGYPNYNEKLLLEIDWSQLAGLIAK